MNFEASEIGDFLFEDALCKCISVQRFLRLDMPRAQEATHLPHCEINGMGPFHISAPHFPRVLAKS